MLSHLQVMHQSGPENLSSALLFFKSQRKNEINVGLRARIVNSTLAQA